MFKNKVKIILVIIASAIFVSGLSVYATYNYLASDVSYTKGGEIISVEQALNELYSKQKELRLINTDSFDSSHYTTGYSRTYDLSSYNDYKNITVNDIYLVVNGISPAVGYNATTDTSYVYFEKTYNNETGSLTVSLPMEAYNKVGVWVNVSIYLYN